MKKRGGAPGYGGGGTKKVVRARGRESRNRNYVEYERFLISASLIKCLKAFLPNSAKGRFVSNRTFQCVVEAESFRQSRSCSLHNNDAFAHKHFKNSSGF